MFNVCVVNVVLESQLTAIEAQLCDKYSKLYSVRNHLKFILVNALLVVGMQFWLHIYQCKVVHFHF